MAGFGPDGWSSPGNSRIWAARYASGLAGLGTGCLDGRRRRRWPARWFPGEGSIALAGQALDVIGDSQMAAESGAIQMCGQSSRVSGSSVAPQLREEPVAGAGGFDRTAVTEASPRDGVRVRPRLSAASPGHYAGPADRQPSGISKTRVPQLRARVVVWLDLGGTYSVASHAESDVSSGTAKE